MQAEQSRQHVTEREVSDVELFGLSIAEAEIQKHKSFTVITNQVQFQAASFGP